MTAGVDPPLFAVVVAAHNAEQTIADTLRSVVAQAGAGAEIVVVDDGSSDGTASAVASSGVPAQVRRQARSGPGAARNAGAALARAPYVWFLDADDILLPGAFAAVAAALRAAPAADFVFASHAVRAPDGATQTVRQPPLTPSSQRNFADYVRRRRPATAIGSVVVARRVLDRIRFPDALHFAEDFVFHAQLLALFDGVALDTPVMEYRIDPARLSRRNLARADDLLRSADLAFDPALLPPELLRLRRAYLGAVHLTLFRAFHRAGEDAAGRAYYHRALALAPLRALRLTYLRKYLRGLAGRKHPSLAS